MVNENIELLQNMIRNKCVNTGEKHSGFESRNADLLESFFNPFSVEIERHSSVESRDNIVVRLPGSDPQAPTLLLLGHTDVVPAVEQDWDYDPFSGDIQDGFVIGRGAIDMLNLTSSMALAFKRIIQEGKKLKGTIIFAGVADEEAGGKYGAGFLLDKHRDLVKADYVLTESGGIQMPLEDKTYLPVMVGEKGVHWLNILVNGTPTHGSKPYMADNAIYSANQIIERIKNYKPQAKFDSTWNTFLRAIGINEQTAQQLSDNTTIGQALTELNLEQSSVIQACCHNTMTANTITGGNKVNTVADHCVIGVDFRSLPGTTKDDVEKILDDIVGDLSNKVTIEYLQHDESTISPTDTPLWHALEEVSKEMLGNTELLPTIATFGTDARYFRKDNSIAYGFGLFSKSIDYAQHLSMFHGRNEKVDIESLGLTQEMYYQVIKKICE